ncbi:MAG: histidine kinase, partial [Candidatus Thorarchaeota archaeon]
TIIYTRDLTFQLSPPILYDVGLEAALQWLLDEIKKHHRIETAFEDDGQIKPLDDNVRVFLFQSVRELLFNITKHAQARRAEIRVERADLNIHITVIDNGIGFDSEQLHQADRNVKGFGLFNIRERLDHLGGEFQIHSQLGKGTTFTLIAPLQINQPTNVLSG